MIPISKIVGRIRSSADLAQDVRDVLQQDGTNYTVRLSSRPISSGSEQIYLTHSTFTTGLNQFVPRDGTQSGPYSSGANLSYTINYGRGEVNFYFGSGTPVPNNTTIAFAPWNTSKVTAYYQKTKYTDQVLANYASFAVADVETALQIGMFVSGISGVAPDPRQYTDNIDYRTSNPYAVDEKYVIVEDVEIIQSLIAAKAVFNLAQMERRVGAGNAIRIKDGDTEIDTAVNQRYLADYVKDLKKDYEDMLKYVMYNMMNGYSLRQIDESSYSMRRGKFTSTGLGYDPLYIYY